MNHYEVYPIGEVHQGEDGAFLQLEKAYIPALKALDGFSHIQVLWWFSELDDEPYRSILQMEQPYKGAPEKMGIFATRSPIRPNPIALTAAQVLSIDYEAGVIQLAFIDANEGTPVLDIKPYTPSFDRIETPEVPHWCAHWPKSSEEAADYDWENEFNF